jgi:hypothetical protein
MERDNKGSKASEDPEPSRTVDVSEEDATKATLVEDAHSTNAESMAERGKAGKDSKTSSMPKVEISSDEEEHRRVFYEPDGRRKGGLMITDYYDFLIRLLNTGSSRTAPTGGKGQDPSHVAQDPSHAAQDPSHAAQDPSHAAQDPSHVPDDKVDTEKNDKRNIKSFSEFGQSKRVNNTATQVRTQSLGALSDEDSMSGVLPDVEEVSYRPMQHQTLHDYHTKVIDIIPIEVELGLRPPRNKTPVTVEVTQASQDSVAQN